MTLPEVVGWAKRKRAHRPVGHPARTVGTAPVRLCPPHRAFAVTTKRKVMFASLLPRFHPLCGPTPERVAMLGAEEAEMADRGRAGVRRRNGQDFRRGRGKPRTQRSEEH